MVDFTNLAAREWIKDIIKTNLVKEGRAGGWMHDFGEYMPFDSVLASGVDPIAYHNQYAADWAAVTKEALSEMPEGDEIVYFMRSATGLSPKDTRLFWMGDQLISYDKFDGL
jgi:alpha-glucosidase